MRHLKGLFILAANENEDRLMHDLRVMGLRWKEVQGCYKGAKERSFVVVNDSETVEPIIRELARFYAQESYLKVTENDRKAFLVYLNDLTAQPIGYFRQVDTCVDDYTIDPDTGQRYACINRRTKQ